MAGWTCASCGGDNPDGTRFCGHCGAPADEPRSEPPTADATTGQDVAQALRSFVAGPVADRLVEAGGTLPEERRLVTALFADVSGFTALADRLDPEQLLEVIDPVISALSTVVGRYEGYVEKFAGDALMALFGAPVSHEDDAVRALHVALEMHRELARVVDELEHDVELTLHVGVNSGHGIARILGSEARMDYAVLGDSVILAQRLESAAPRGETYVSETTVRLTEDAFEFEPVGELELKGKAEPVPAWRLVGVRDEPRVRGATTLVGRDQELSELEPALDGGLVTLTGEPGVGKSHLVEALRARAAAGGVGWLAARCLSYGAGIAYWPYTELLRGDPAAQTVPHFARLLGGEAGDELEHLEPEAFRRGLHDAFTAWFGSRAVGGAVLVFEDAHWADASSLALTRELLRIPGLGVILTARPEAAATLAELADDGRAHAIELEPLGPDAVALLAVDVLGSPAPPAVADLILARTDGNPFFVKELLRGLRDAGLLVRDGETWQLRPDWNDADVPPTIEGVLAARIDLLPRAAAGTLGTASVIGRRVRLPLLKGVGGELGLYESIDQLVAAVLLERTSDDGIEVLAFHHALVQDVAYSRLLRRHRRDLHHRVADVAEELYGAGDDVIELLARHLYLAEAGDKAVSYLVRAGDRAKRLFANAEAIIHFERAAELSSSTEITLQLADLYEVVGAYDRALDAYEHVRAATGDVRAWRGLAATHRKRGEYLQAFQTINDAFTSESLRGVDVLPLWLESAWSLSVSGRLDEAVDVVQAALATADGRRDLVVGDLLLQLAHAETLRGNRDEAIAQTRSAEEVFAAADDARGLARTMRIRGNAEARAGRLDAAAATLRRGLELAERTGNVEEIGGCLINLGIVEFERGELDKAIAYDLQAIEEFERVGHGSGRTTGYANVAHKLAEAGRLDEAEAWCRRALELADRIGHAVSRADATDTLARIHLKQEHYSLAAELAEEAASLYVASGIADQAQDAFGVAAEAWEHAGQAERARAATARARDLATA